MASKLPKLLGIVGSGQMGTGIAQVRRRGCADGDACDQSTPKNQHFTPTHPPQQQVAAVKGLDVLLIDADARALDRARANLSRALDRVVGRSTLARGDADAALGRVRTDNDIEVSG